jgi:hypothetical protein
MHGSVDVTPKVRTQRPELHRAWIFGELVSRVASPGDMDLGLDDRIGVRMPLVAVRGFDERLLPGAARRATVAVELCLDQRLLARNARALGVGLARWIAS